VRWCHSWWTDSGARCRRFSSAQSIFHSRTLARSRIPHLALSSIAHPWQKATSSRLLCSAVSCGIIAQVLLALPQFVIVGSGRSPRAPTQLSGKTHLRQHHDGGGDGEEGGTSVGVSDVRTHSFLNPHSLHVAVGLYPCNS